MDAIKHRGSKCLGVETSEPKAPASILSSGAFGEGLTRFIPRGGGWGRFLKRNWNGVCGSGCVNHPHSSRALPGLGRAAAPHHEPPAKLGRGATGTRGGSGSPWPGAPSAGLAQPHWARRLRGSSSSRLRSNHGGGGVRGPSGETESGSYAERERRAGLRRRRHCRETTPNSERSGGHGSRVLRHGCERNDPEPRRRRARGSAFLRLGAAGLGELEGYPVYRCLIDNGRTPAVARHSSDFK